MRLESTGEGWLASDFAGDESAWRWPLPSRVVAELLSVDPSILSGSGMSGEWPYTEQFACDVRSRLRARPGFVVLSGFPVGVLDGSSVTAAYWKFGLALGCPVSQSLKGDLIGRVEDRGADISDPNQRGYESSSALPFHADRTDIVGLLCIRSSPSGGYSRLVSSKAVHDILRREEPDLLAELYRPLPNDRRGEQPSGEAPWCDIPVFSQVGSSFAARYVRRFIEGSQRHSEAPRLSTRQRAALDALDAILKRPGISLDMALRPGDLQLINNFHILHARTAFPGASAGNESSRLLLRLWLASADSPKLPALYMPLYGATGSGLYRGGVWPTGVVPADFGRPVQEATPPVLDETWARP